MSLEKQLLEKRRKKAAAVQKARHLLDTVDGEKRQMTAQESTDYDTFMGDIDALDGEIRTVKADIERRKKLARLEGELGDQPGPTVRPTPQNDSNEARIGMSRAEMRQYSIVRAIQAMDNVRRGQRDPWRDATLELEASRAVVDLVGVEPQGFYVPHDVVTEQRDLNVGTPTAGGNLVATDLLASSLIELLRNRLILRQAGITVLGGLVGNVDIPKVTGGATAYWVGEGSSPTESQQSVGQVSLTPHTVGAFTDFTRRLIKQSSLDVEGLVRRDLAWTQAVAIDYAGLHGNSSTDANQPDGLMTHNVGAVAGGTNGAAPTWANIVQLESEVAADNADIGRLSYVTNARVRGKLKTTVKASGTAQFIWSGGQMNGYNALVSNQVRSDLTKGSGTDLSAIFFGNWADLVLGMWGGLDIMVDPYTHSTSGTMRIVALQDVDYALRRAESFAVMSDAITS